MSEGIWLLLGLLLIAYLGSNLVGGRAIRGFGLPSGSEYLVLGFALAASLPLLRAKPAQQRREL